LDSVIAPWILQPAASDHAGLDANHEHLLLCCRYEMTKSEKAISGGRAAEKGEKKQKELQAFINKNIGGGAKGAKMANSRQKMLDKMDTYEKATPKDALVKFKIPTPGPVAGGWGIRLVGVGFGYPGQELLFTKVEFSINQNSRICLVGPNGTRLCDYTTVYAYCSFSFAYFQIFLLSQREPKC
jgi:ABC-type multidrug transport system fused ATPase/permease subunit